LLVPLLANAGELVGTWTVVPPSAEGVIRYETLTFVQQDGGLRGELSTLPPEGDPVTLRDIRFSGNQLTFTTAHPDDNGAPDHLMRWHGQLDAADELHLTRQFEQQQPTQSVLKHRSSQELAALQTQIARNLTTTRISLPALQPLASNGRAPTPPLGWNSWNQFATRVDDRTVRAAADLLVSSGLRDAGFVYVNIDDGWQGRRDAQGALQPNSKFPDMKALADYVHARGLKLGIYSSPGPVTCAGYVGSHGHEEQDARTFAGWGIDLLKYDWCSAAALYSTQYEMQALYQKMGAALRDTHRPIVFSLCQYGLFDVSTWGRKVGGNLWRTGGDSVLGDRWSSVNSRFDADGDARDAGPGGWNDPDIMLIGNGGLTVEEYRTHVTLWAMLAAPLLLGNDLQHMSTADKALIDNREVLAIDQDALGRQAHRVAKHGALEIWARPLASGATAIALFNRAKTSVSARADWSRLGLGTVRQVRNLWQQQDLPQAQSAWEGTLPAHASVLLLIRH
jgi:alpha-galactosidase